MLRAIIIDDESSGVESLDLLLKAKFSEDVKVVAATTDPYQGLTQINNFHPDIVFLDINMPDMDGFDLLKKIEFKDFNLIFTTAHTKYALQALRQQPVDYLLKPVSSGDLMTVIEKIKSRRRKMTDMNEVYSELKAYHEAQNIRVALPNKNGIEHVPPENIVYIEADGYSCKIQLKGTGLVQVPKLLKEYEQILCIKYLSFIRIQNSFIINVKHVSRFLKEEGGIVVMSDQKRIPVSKQRRKDFFRMINMPFEEE